MNFVSSTSIAKGSLDKDLRFVCLVDSDSELNALQNIVAGFSIK